MSSVRRAPNLRDQSKELNRRLAELERRTGLGHGTTREGGRLETSWDGATLRFYVDGVLVKAI